MIYTEYEQLDGKKIAYIRTGEWKENIIVFFHGFTGSKEYFPDGNANATIVSFDRPGIGESDISEYYLMETYLKNIYDILRKHQVSSVNVIGHSAGGYYAQMFTSLYPEFVKTLSLVSSMIPLNCPKTKNLINGQWKFINLLSLKAKKISKFYFKMMAQSINKDYDKQLEANLKTLPEIEKKFMEDNPEMIRNAIINAVRNQGLGVCFDAYALCQKRNELSISKDIPVFVWHGQRDTTLPLSFVDYFVKEYSVKQVHKIDNAGHMLYLPYWDEILSEIIES